MIKEEGMSTEDRTKLENELFEVIVEFEKKFKRFFLSEKMLNQKLKPYWQEEIKKLSFKMCVINKSKLMLLDTQNASFIDSDGIHLMPDNVSEIDDAKAWLKTEYNTMLIETMEKEIISHSGNDDLVGEYHILIVMVYDRNSSKSFQFNVKVMLSFVEKIITDLQHLKQLSIQDDWREFVKGEKFEFIQWYKNKIFETKEVPNSDAITKIGFLNYENRPNCGALILLDKEKWNNLSRGEAGTIRFSEETRVCFDDVNDVKKGPEKMIRKMLETCGQKGGKNCFLIAESSAPYTIIGIVTNKFFEDKIANEEYWEIDYLGYGDWRMHYKEEVLLVYDKGRFKLDEEQNKQELQDKVNAIEILEEDRQKNFEEILKRLQMQSHGALMIVAEDAEAEANRLCAKFKKGTLIEKIDLTDSRNLDLLDGIASVDGAVLVDPNGICYGFSVILDGEAKIEGDIGKGSRFNSSVNYVAGYNRSAIIVSEDKTNGVKVENGMRQAILN